MYALHIGTVERTKYLLCELQSSQMANPQLMYKMADFLSAFHLSNDLDFNYTILFISYNSDRSLDHKQLLYTDLKGNLEDQWKQFITLLDGLVNPLPTDNALDEQPIEYKKHLFQVNIEQSQVSLKIDSPIPKKCFDHVMNQLAGKNGLQGVKYQLSN